MLLEVIEDSVETAGQPDMSQPFNVFLPVIRDYSPAYQESFRYALTSAVKKVVLPRSIVSYSIIR